MSGIAQHPGHGETETTRFDGSNESDKDRKVAEKRGTCKYAPHVNVDAPEFEDSSASDAPEFDDSSASDAPEFEDMSENDKDRKNAEKRGPCTYPTHVNVDAPEFDDSSASDKDRKVAEKRGTCKYATPVNVDAPEFDDWVEVKKDQKKTEREHIRKFPTRDNPVTRHFDEKDYSWNETDVCDEQAFDALYEFTQKTIQALKQKKVDARELARSRKKKDSTDQLIPPPKRAKTTCTSDGRGTFLQSMGKGRSIKFDDSSDTEGGG